MAHNLIQVWSGKEQVLGKLAQLLVLVCPTPANRLDSEMFFSKAASSADTDISVVQPSRRHEAAPGKIDQMGHWWSVTADVPDGEVIRLVGTRKGGSFGSRQDQASLIIQARAGAALRKITFRLTGDPIMARDEVTVEGRFDVLPIEEVEEQFLDLIKPWQRATYIESKVSRVFKLSETAPELTPRPVVRTRTVINADGEAVSVRVRSRARKLRI